MRQIWAFPQATGTIVVGCDGSRESQNAVVAAMLEASSRGTELILLAVAKHRPCWPESFAMRPTVEAESERHARAVADQALAYVEATCPAVAVRAAVVTDLESDQLAEFAHRAGLLVLGRNGIGGLATFSMGSTSAELARRFHCPMLVVHDQGRPSQHERLGRDAAVVAGMAIVSGASPVLAVAVSEAAIRSLPLVVVHTLPSGRLIDEAAVAESWRSARAALHQAHLPANVPSRLVVTQEDPASALLQRARPGDLLVVGTHGNGRLAGLIAGSVSRHVLDNMRCDVLVVRSPAPSEPAASPAPVSLAGRS